MGDTGWSQVVAFYDQLEGLDPAPIVTLKTSCGSDPGDRWATRCSNRRYFLTNFLYVTRCG
ncbi:MAG: hypothetical protein ACREN3_00810 [Gemmatimonadaceae bacterium]